MKMDDLKQILDQAGINYINGANTVTYFGGMAFDSKKLEE